MQIDDFRFQIGDHACSNLQSAISVPRHHLCIPPFVTSTKTGFLATFDSVRHADAVVDRLHHVTLSAHRLKTVESADELVETRPGLGRLATGISTGAALGVGIGALAAILVPGAGAFLLAGFLASMAGFGSAGAAVGGLLGAMAGDETIEETVRFIHNAVVAGEAVIVVETDALSHDAAVLFCQSAAGRIHELNRAESLELNGHSHAGLPEQSHGQAVWAS
jgi:hypothetical protein